MEMKHFTTEEWIDFVNQVASNSRQAVMQKHLETGCERCKETVGLWQKVRKTAALARNYEPPTASLRIVKAAYAASALAGKRRGASRIAELLYDSSLQPALAGARSAGTGMRQMLYRADPYQVDIQVEAKPEGNRLMITGQILNVSRPEAVGNKVPVTLSNRRGFVVHTMTNEFGEFRGEIENSGDLELTLPGAGEQAIVISLRNALDRLPGGKS